MKHNPKKQIALLMLTLILGSLLWANGPGNALARRQSAFSSVQVTVVQQVASTDARDGAARPMVAWNS